MNQIYIQCYQNARNLGLELDTDLRLKKKQIKKNRYPYNKFEIQRDYFISSVERFFLQYIIIM